MRPLRPTLWLFARSTKSLVEVVRSPKMLGASIVEFSQCPVARLWKLFASWVSSAVPLLRVSLCAYLRWKPHQCGFGRAGCPSKLRVPGFAAACAQSKPRIVPLAAGRCTPRFVCRPLHTPVNRMKKWGLLFAYATKHLRHAPGSPNVR